MHSRTRWRPSAPLTKDPGPQVKLALYALFKQASDGDVKGKRPGFTDFVGRAKYDAWAALSGNVGRAGEG
jgi:diazepam-binding inhibitor (GABA receptor modulating acyl-CoA-binding protein)